LSEMRLQRKVSDLGFGQKARDLTADSDEVGRAFRMMSATSFQSKPAGDSD
jgi:hypothetical protein